MSSSAERNLTEHFQIEYEENCAFNNEVYDRNLSFILQLTAYEQ